jgi:hypothetical chaperone protein
MFLLKDPKTMAVLREVKSQATEPQKVSALIQIISENLGYALYRAVEETKLQLTDHEVATFNFLPLMDHDHSSNQNHSAVAQGSLQEANHSPAHNQNHSAVAHGPLAGDSTPVASGTTILERWRFESWIQADIQSIAQTVQTLLHQCGLKPSDVDSVFLTGGSSFVPYVRRYFSKTFGPTKLRSGEELTTVAKGLALRALEED